MKLNALLNQTAKAISKRSPELLVAFGLVNVGFAVFNAIKDTTKAMPKVYEKAEETDGTITVSDVIRTAAPCYTRTATHTVLAVGSIILGTKMSYTQKQALEMSLAATKLISSEYAKNVKALNPDVDKEAKLNAAKTANQPDQCKEGEIIFEDTFTGKRFTSTETKVIDAEYETNRWLICKGIVSLGDFYKLLGLESNPNDNKYGWCSDAEPFYGYKWIDFKHQYIKDPKNKNREICRIIYTFEPHDDYQDISFAATGGQIPFNT